MEQVLVFSGGKLDHTRYFRLSCSDSNSLRCCHLPHLFGRYHRLKKDHHWSFQITNACSTQVSESDLSHAVLESSSSELASSRTG
jgi:hypothetical protein